MKFKTSLNYNMGYYLTKRITPLRKDRLFLAVLEVSLVLPTAQFITMEANVTVARRQRGLSKLAQWADTRQASVIAKIHRMEDF